MIALAFRVFVKARACLFGGDGETKGRLANGQTRIAWAGVCPISNMDGHVSQDLRSNDIQHAVHMKLTRCVGLRNPPT